MILVTGGTGLVGCHLLYNLVLDNKKVKIGTPTKYLYSFHSLI